MKNVEYLFFQILIAETELAWNTSNRIRDEAYNLLSGHINDNVIDETEQSFVETIINLAEAMDQSIEQEISKLRDSYRLEGETGDYKASIAPDLIDELQVLLKQHEFINYETLREIASNDWKERHGTDS